MVKLMRQKILKRRRWTSINSTERQQNVSVRSEPMEAGREEVSAGLPHSAGSATLTEKRRQGATWPPGCPSGNSGFVWQYLHSAETKTVHRVMHAASSGATETGPASLVCTGREHFKAVISHDIISCHANVRSPDLSPLDPLTLLVRPLWDGSLFCVHLAFPPLWTHVSRRHRPPRLHLRSCKYAGYSDHRLFDRKVRQRIAPMCAAAERLSVV